MCAQFQSVFIHTRSLPALQQAELIDITEIGIYAEIYLCLVFVHVLHYEDIMIIYKIIIIRITSSNFDNECLKFLCFSVYINFDVLYSKTSTEFVKIYLLLVLCP